jgi:hypothetical protein
MHVLAVIAKFAFVDEGKDANGGSFFFRILLRQEWSEWFDFSRLWFPFLFTFIFSLIFSVSQQLDDFSRRFCGQTKLGKNAGRMTTCQRVILLAFVSV